jgi:hypothetical protein
VGANSRLKGFAMVTALSSTRLIAAQLALKVLISNDSSDDSNSGSSSLLGNSSSGSSLSSLPSASQASLASLLNSLSSSQSDDSTSLSSSTSTTASTDITTASFMALLKQNLTATAAGTSDLASQAQAMLDALKAGTLTVSDPTSGVSIVAWDPSAKKSTDSSTATSSAAANTATAIPTTDWNDFLKTHLKRNSDGTFARAADNSFIDKATGSEAYFGQVGSQFYYLTWTDPSDKAASASASSGTVSTGGTAA